MTLSKYMYQVLRPRMISGILLYDFVAYSQVTKWMRNIHACVHWENCRQLTNFNGIVVQGVAYKQEKFTAEYICVYDLQLFWLEFTLYRLF